MLVYQRVVDASFFIWPRSSESNMELGHKTVALVNIKLAGTSMFPKIVDP